VIVTLPSIVILVMLAVMTLGLIATSTTGSCFGESSHLNDSTIL
jgi:hypothetical protein